MTQIIDLGKLRFHFAGDWVSTTIYESNDVVKYGGNVYVYTYALKTSTNLPTNSTYWALMVEGFKFQGVYSDATDYRLGDGVTHGGKVYIAILDGTGNTPPNLTYWSQFADGIQYEGDYVSVNVYQKGDLVKYGSSAYIALQDTTGNLPTNLTFWAKLVEGVSASGAWSAETNYVPNDLVAYGANQYKSISNNTNQTPISSTGTVNSSNWAVQTEGIRSRNDWTTATEYYINDVVTHGGNSYIALAFHASTVFDTDLASTKWQKFNSGIRWRDAWATGTAYLTGDIVKDAVGSAYIATEDHTSAAAFTTDVTTNKWEVFVVGGSDILPVIPSNASGKSLSVETDGVSLSWLNATGSNKVYYVAPHGVDVVTSGESLAAPFASIKYACSIAGNNATIFVKTGTYNEQLPIVIGDHTAIVGDNQRTVIVQPLSGTSDDGVTPNNQSSMFLMGDGSILNKMTFKGMTGWIPGSTAADITTSVPKGIVVQLNHASPVLTKSPYVLECTAIGSGLIGAFVDGTAHASGNLSMIFHGYTIISDNGVGYWIKDGGKAEIVSCFTYFCYFGYATTGGGFVRALNGNNSYGTWGATSRGFDSAEVALTGSLVGQQLNFLYGGGNILAGDVINTTSGGTAVVTNVRYSADKMYIKSSSGTFIVGEDITIGGSSVGTVAAGGLEDQKGFVLVTNGFNSLPIPGSSIEIAGDSISYVIQSVSNTWVDTSSELILVLSQEKPTGSPATSAVTLRRKFSQIRLTGHDFLSIGTGGTTTTNYPGTPTQPAAQGNEIEETYPGRVYYVSTDQDGNFRVGEYFRIDQATGRATLNANAFDLSGLTSLKLGSIGAQLGETINEFSNDNTLSGNSNTAVPTEYAVKNYVDSAQAIALLGNIYGFESVAETFSANKITKINAVSFSGDVVIDSSANFLIEGTHLMIDLASVNDNITVIASYDDTSTVSGTVICDNQRLSIPPWATITVENTANLNVREIPRTYLL